MRSTASHTRDVNVAVIFAIAIISLLAFVGVSVDFSRTNAVKASMQSALAIFSALFKQRSATNIRPTGVKIYTIQVNTGHDPTATLMQSGNSDSRQHFPADLGRPDGHRVRNHPQQPDPATGGEIASSRRGRSSTRLHYQ